MKKKIDQLFGKHDDEMMDTGFFFLETTNFIRRYGKLKTIKVIIKTFLRIK